MIVFSWFYIHRSQVYNKQVAEARGFTDFRSLTKYVAILLRESGVVLLLYSESIFQIDSVVSEPLGYRQTIKLFLFIMLSIPRLV